MEVQVKQTNGLGTTGFVLAIVGVFFGWIPFFGWIIWVLGLIFSAVGLKNKPKGLAIAGLVVSLVSFIILWTLTAAAVATSAAL